MKFNLKRLQVDRDQRTVGEVPELVGLALGYLLRLKTTFGIRKMVSEKSWSVHIIGFEIVYSIYETHTGVNNLVVRQTM